MSPIVLRSSNIANSKFDTTAPNTANMADVEMTDAPPKTKVTTKAGASGEAEGKKRFEVKKVGLLAAVTCYSAHNI